MQVFVSHITEESPIAILLKRFIEEHLKGVAVFVSSDARDLTPGARWMNTIESALATSDVLIVVCSRTSLTRPWINFETGCAWIRKLGIIPICHSGQRPHQLPFPFSELQGLQLEDEHFGERLMAALCGHFKIGWTPSINGGLQSDIRAAKNMLFVPDASPQVVHSPIERTQLINNDLRTLLASRELHNETVWTSAFLSTFAIGPSETRLDIVRADERQLYLELLQEERKLLLSLARGGCTIKCIISPANRNYIRHAGIQHAILRTTTLIELLESEDRNDRLALEHIDWAASELGTKNLYIIGQISCFEGYKKGLQHGYGLTLRQTAPDVIRANVDLYSRLFRDLAAATLAKWSKPDDDASGECEYLRSAISRCLADSREYLCRLADQDPISSGYKP